MRAAVQLSLTAGPLVDPEKDGQIRYIQWSGREDCEPPTPLVPEPGVYQAEPLPDISFSPDVSSVYSTRADPAIRPARPRTQNSIVPKLTVAAPRAIALQVITPGSH